MALRATGEPSARYGRRVSPAHRVDVAIVGGGHNGLTAAAYLAAAGRSCTVLERRGEFGGAAVSERPFAGVDARLSRYAYLVSLFPTSIVEDLGLAHELRLARRPVSSYTPDPRAPGRGLLVDHDDVAATRASFHAVTGSDGEFAAFTDFYAATAAVAGALFPTLTEPLRSRAEIRALIADDAVVRRAVRTPDRRRDRGGPDRRPGGRCRPHRRIDRDVRAGPRRRPAPEPLLPVPRDRRRHRRLARADRRDGRRVSRAWRGRRRRPARG